jgi:hypothetical protein
LHLVNDPLIEDSIDAPDGRVAKLMAANPEPRKIVDEIFLAALCREPTEQEYSRTLPMFAVGEKAVSRYLDEAGDRDDYPTAAEAKSVLRTRAAQDLMWALVNSPAFLFNR